MVPDSLLFLSNFLGTYIAYKFSIMRLHRTHITAINLLFLCLFCLGINQFVSAQEVALNSEETLSVDEQALFDLINEARRDPLQMAVSMGFDTEQLVKDLPHLEEILTRGLPPLEFDRKLYEAARGHAKDMLASGYYSHDSPDGRSYDDRIRETGYAPSSTGESLGFLAFNNFLEPGYAVQVIFEKMYKEELDPAGTGVRNILNPDLRQVGIAVDSGIFETSGAALNAYMAVADFAYPLDLYTVEKRLWRLVNEARRSPLNALDAAGIDEESAREALGEDSWILDQGLPPLAWNKKLYGSARAHYSDMATLGYYSTESPDGTTPEERIASTGYQPVQAGEALGYATIYGSYDPAEVARLIYESMLRAELDPETTVEKVIFSPDPKEVGIACGKVPLDSKESQEGIAFIVAADFALPSDPAVFVLGNIYDDLDGDHVYNPGEGIKGLTVALGTYGAESRNEMHTDILGNYQLEIVPGFLQIAVVDDSGTKLESSLLFWSEGYSLLMDMRMELIGEETVAQNKMGTASASVIPSMAITW